MTLKIDPVPKPRMSRSDVWKKRPIVERYWAFKDELNLLVKGELEPSLKLVFHVPMPKSWTKKKKADMDGKPHQQKPDVDNYIKAFLDALCTDDSYIYHVDGWKFWSTEGAIEVEELDHVL